MGAGTTHNTASAAVEAVLASILTAVQDEKVHLPHLGTFQTINRPARTGFDINTGEHVTFPARAKLTFRPASSLHKQLQKRTAPTYQQAI